MYRQPIIEMQVSATAFLAAQLLAVQTRRLTFPPPISLGATQVMVDHVEFGANSLRHSIPREEFIYYKASLSNVFDRVSGRQAQIAQPFTVFLADMADILSHPNQPPASLIPIPGTIVLNLEYGVGSDGTDRLQFAFAGLESGPLPPLPPGVDPAALDLAIQSFARSLASGKPAVLGLAGRLVGLGPNVGMSIDSTLTRLAFRWEMGDGIQQDVDIWRSFYQGDVPDRLVGAGWAIFQSASVLEISAQLQIEQGLNEHPNPRFQLVSGVGSTYSNGGGAARVTSQLSGNVDAGICTVWTDITVSSVLTVAASNSLTLDTELSWKTATTACTVTAAILGGILGLAANFVAPLGSLIVDPIVGALGGIAAVVYLDNTIIPPFPGSPDCTKTSDTHLTCVQTLPLTTTPLGTLSFTTLAALDDGISLQGQLNAIPVGVPVAAIAIDIPFHWSATLAGGCGDANKQAVRDFSKNPEAFVSLNAAVSIASLARAPVFLVSAQVVRDTLNVFSKGLIAQGQRAPIEITIGVPYPGDDYFRNAYPCQILISTTAGVRLISIPAPPALSPAEISRVEAQLARQEGNCNNLIDDWFSHHRTYNPVWSVDPPAGETVDHSYEFEVDGLRDGEAVTLVDSGGRALQIGVARIGQSLQLSAIVTPGIRDEVGLVRGGEVDGAAGSIVETAIGALRPAHGNLRRLRATGTLLIRTALIALPGVCRRIAAAYWDGVPCVFAVLDDRLLAFDVSDPSLPAASYSWRIPGLRGVLTYGAELLAFGDEGFVPLDSTSARPDSCLNSTQAPVYEAVTGQDVVYALTDQGLEVFSRRLRRLTTVEIEPSRILARVGSNLAAGGSKGIAVIRLADPKRPASKEFFHMTGLQALAIPAVGDGRCVLAVANPGPSKLIDIAAEDPRVVAAFPQVPWYAGAARLKDVVVQLLPERTAINVSFFGTPKDL